MTSSWSMATGASDRQARATLARWPSTVIGSPRRCRALPPRATTILIPGLRSIADRGDHDRLDRVQPVLRLVEGDVRRGTEDLVGDLEPVGDAGQVGDLAAHGGVRVVEGRQAVHEPHPRVPGLLQSRGVDLVGRELLYARLPDVVRLPHRHPD